MVAVLEAKGGGWTPSHEVAQEIFKRELYLGRRGESGGAHQRVTAQEIDDLLFSGRQHIVIINALYWSKQIAGPAPGPRGQ